MENFNNATISEHAVAADVKKKLYHTVLNLHDIAMFEITDVDNICPDMSKNDNRHFIVAVKGWRTDKLLRQDGSKFAHTYEYIMHNMPVTIDEAGINVELERDVIKVADARKELEAYHAVKNYMDAFDKRGQK